MTIVLELEVISSEYLPSVGSFKKKTGFGYCKIMNLNKDMLITIKQGFIKIL